MEVICYGQKKFTPSSNNSITGPTEYCQNVTAGQILYNYNTCNIGSGVSTGTPLIINWYSNSTNSTIGGTVVSTTLVNCSLNATGTTNYQPSTATIGTIYYYCRITWSAAGVCNSSDTLTSPITSVTTSIVPDPISGSPNGCIGTTTLLSDAPSGGIWSSTNTTVASISPSGVVNAITSGTTTISYTLGICAVSKSFNSIVSPAAITGTNTVCQASITTLSDATAGGTWSSANTSIATVNASSPVGVTGVNAGTTNITYSFSSGCYVTKSVTVNTTPTAITGVANACVGASSTLYNSISGGIWSSAATSRATVDSFSGVVTAVATGATVSISYTIGNCKATTPFTIKANPVAISGTNSVCMGSITTLSDATSGGTWNITNPTIATINASSPVGVTGLTVGSTTITYTTANSCYTTSPVTVNISPGAVMGLTSACAGNTLTLSNTVSGGRWSSATISKATIDSISGVLTTLAAGTSAISYTIGSCKSGITFTVLNTPAAIGAVTTSVCAGSTITFTNTVAGGTWSSSNTAVATITSGTGVIRGVSAGSATITYIIGTCYVTKNVTVNIQPAAITGSTIACTGSLATLSNTISGGTWSSSNTTIATISSFGVVTPLSNGTTAISYTIGSCASGITFTALTSPASIGSTSTIVCQGSTITYTNTTIGGSWSSSNTAIATVNAATGIVSGVNPGSATITYSTGCGTAATKPITVSINPAAISGSSAMCTGAMSTLTNSVSGGVWTSGSTSIATINSSTGAVSPLSTGTTIITYTMAGTCSTTKSVSVNTQPAAITGIGTLCIATSITLSNTITGGTWSSSNSAIATVNTATGIVNSITAGNVTVTYSTGCGTPAVKPITVFNTPAAISGSSSICTGSTTTLTDIVTGGVWSSSTPASMTIDSLTGIATALSAGISTITYTIGNTCSITYPITIITQPGPITASAAMCSGVSVTLYNTVAGGTWSSSNTSIISVTSTAGIAAGITTGTASITYSNSLCFVTTNFTVGTIPATPAIITGASTLCSGRSTTLYDTTTGGMWSIADNSIASINSSTGLANALTEGNTTTSYTVTNSCGSSYATRGFTVHTTPAAAITSAPVACINSAVDITVSGTSGANFTYNVDGGSNITQTLTAGVYNINTGTVTTTHTYNLIEVHNSFCAATIDTSVVVSPIPMQWVGGAPGHENDWHNSANWTCNYIPDSLTDVTIPAGTIYNPVLTSNDTEQVQSISIATGASITCNSGAILNVLQRLNNNGILSGDGTIGLNGNATQTISGIGAISNLLINNTSDAVIDTGSRLTITKILKLNKGSIYTNDSLVMASDSSGNSSIAAIPSGSSVNGKVKIMQYVQGGYRRFRFWSHPFNSAISLSQIKSAIDITGTGGATNGFTTTSSNAASAFRLDTRTSNSAMSYDPGWKAFTKINAGAADSNLLQPHQGIRLFFRGTKGQGLGYTFIYTPAPVTVTMTGEINQGDQTITLAKGVDTNQDYNMVGNPYPSPVDIGTVLFNAKQAGDITGAAFYVWNPAIGAAGQYIAIPIGLTTAEPYSLQANTAFQIRAMHNGNQLHFTEQNKTATNNNNLLKPHNNYTVLKIYDTNYNLWDMLQLQYNESTTTEEDKYYDAIKLLGTDFSFYSLTNTNKKLTIDTRPYSSNDAIPLGIASAYTQDFIISVDNLEIPNGTKLYLHDKLLQNYKELTPGSEYKFTITNNKKSQGDERFELTTKVIDNSIASSTQVSLTPNPATDEVVINYGLNETGTVSIRLIDQMGICIYNREVKTAVAGKEKISLTNIVAGIYVVEIVCGNSKTTHKLVKE